MDSINMNLEKKSMELSILLPTLGARIDELKRLFISLENQNNKSFELIIVSQGNHKIIEELLREFSFKYKQIKIDKKGLSLARNISCQYFLQETILFYLSLFAYI